METWGQEEWALENSHARKLVLQRHALDEKRQQLNALTRLRSDLGRQLSALDRADGNPAAERRVHLGDSIRLVEVQIEEARVHVDGCQRVLRRLERLSDSPAPRARRRGRPPR
jgi:hypothetical protein